jgi:hypothetical protein
MILSSLYYLPQISWFKEVIHEQSITLEQYDNWQKSSLRNKSIITGPNGLQTLSIPIIGGREQRSLYKDVRICYQEKWQHNHLLSIKSAYGSAPFFEHYIDYFKPFYRKKTEFLFDYNSDLLQLCFKLLKSERELLRSEVYKKEIPDVRDIRNLKVTSNELKPYIQVFGQRIGFQAEVSILDLLFNEGPAARDYLMG